jgi:uncharacterized protein (DUF302 family)
MKNWFLIALVAILIQPALFAQNTVNNGLLIKVSKQDFAQTLKQFEAALKERGFTVFAKIDHAAEAKKAGLEMKPTVVLIWGNPKGGTPLMNAAPSLAIDLPLKTLIAEDGDRVVLSYNSIPFLKARHTVNGLDEALTRLEAALEAVTNAAVQ